MAKGRQGYTISPGRAGSRTIIGRMKRRLCCTGNAVENLWNQVAQHSRLGSGPVSNAVTPTDENEVLSNVLWVVVFLDWALEAAESGKSAGGLPTGAAASKIKVLQSCISLSLRLAGCIITKACSGKISSEDVIRL